MILEHFTVKKKINLLHLSVTKHNLLKGPYYAQSRFFVFSGAKLERYRALLMQLNQALPLYIAYALGGNYLDVPKNIK